MEISRKVESRGVVIAAEGAAAILISFLDSMSGNTIGRMPAAIELKTVPCLPMTDRDHMARVSRPPVLVIRSRYGHQSSYSGRQNDRRRHGVITNNTLSNGAE